MITIKRDDDVITCSTNTFEIMYKRLGYEIVDTSKKIDKKEIEVEKVEEIPVIETEIEKKETTKKTNTKSKKK